MSTKDYRAIAAMLAEQFAYARAIPAHCDDCNDALRTTERITVSLADLFRHDNPRFNRQHFYNASESGLTA